jgi:hypothetical protein
MSDEKVPVPTTLSLTGSAPAVETIDPKWCEAIDRAEATLDTAPLVEYLRPPGTRLGLADCFRLRRLLERVTFKRTKPGRYVPLAGNPKKQIHEEGAAYVREQQQAAKARGKRLSIADAVDLTVQAFPQWFGPDEGASLANFIQRGSTR